MRLNINQALTGEKRNHACAGENHPFKEKRVYGERGRA
jgi:hypothetical protein